MTDEAPLASFQVYESTPRWTIVAMRNFLNTLLIGECDRTDELIALGILPRGHGRKE